MNGDRVTVTYHPRITLEFDSEGRAQQVISSDTGDLEDYNIITVWSEQLMRSTFFVVNSLEVNIRCRSWTISNLSSRPKYFLISTTKKVVILAHLVVLPKLKGFPIVKGLISDKEVMDALVWFHLLTDE